MTITTKKNVTDQVFVFNEYKLAIEKGTVLNVFTESNCPNPANPSEVITNIRYNIQLPESTIQKIEDQVFSTKQEVIDTIEANSI